MLVAVAVAVVPEKKEINQQTEKEANDFTE